jgi:hypothetical protein
MDGRLEPREDEQRVTARVHALRAEGLPLRVITRTLASDGVSGRTGRALTLTQVARIARLSRTGA